MQVDNTLKSYNLDRKAASKLLKVSIRTVDRYIKLKKLSTKAIDGRIWLNKKEIQDFTRVDNKNMSTSHKSIDKVDNIEVVSQENVYSVSTKKSKSREDLEVYKKLYSEVKEELNEKQERLEIANYRVGQLEAQVRNSVPMLEYHRENFEKKQKEEEFKQEIEHRETMIKKLHYGLKQQKFNKNVFLIILLAILALQPLWLLYIYNN